MAKSYSAASTVILCLILVSASMPASECFERPAPVTAREEDIKCSACKKIAKQLYLYRQAKDKQAQSPPQEITDEEIVQITKKTCNLKEEADSTRKMNTVEQGDKLKLADQDTEAMCDAECKTMHEACNEVMEYADLVSDFLNEPDPHLDGIERYVCKNVTTPCISKHSPAAETSRRFRFLQGTLEALRLGEADEDDDEDEDEDTDLPPRMGEVLGEEKSRKGSGKVAKFVQTAKEKFSKAKGWFGRFGNRKPGSKKNSKTDNSEL